MVYNKRSNDKYFQRIPAPEIPPAEEIMKLLRKKYGLKEQRTELVRRLQEQRRELYNLSKSINALEVQIDRILIGKLQSSNKN